MDYTLYLLIISPFLVSVFLAIILGIVALKSYSRTGPKIKGTIEKNFRLFAIFAFLRLTVWSSAIFFYLALPGATVLFVLAKAVAIDSFNGYTSAASALISILIASTYTLCYQLLYIPSSLQLSCQFRFSRLLPIWRKLTPRLLIIFKILLITTLVTTCSVGYFIADAENNLALENYFISLMSFYLFSIYWNNPNIESKISNIAKQNGTNIIMIGVDTLRTDRLGESGYHRNLTPNIDTLCKKGIFFQNCITPLARTAPSLTSLLTGLWPHHHLIRDNYPKPTQCQLPQSTLINLLNNRGYFTAALSDWAGADFGKIKFGFQELSVPDDQWNLKLLLRQGPAYLRLFLSLFTHNKFGKVFLPELYYLAGIPLTSHLGSEYRRTITRLAKQPQPFLINLFASSTHVPFGSEYPYYNLYTPKNYTGESRFIMGDLSTPELIVDSQESRSDAHDINQIINLYDSCVKEFDDEVGKIIAHIEKCGLMDNTIIVLYSDHGTDFFETECWGQGNTLIGNDPSGQIPLIISGRGIPKGVKFPHVCRTIDFMPTLLDLLDIEIPDNIDGISLLPYLQNKQNPNLFAFQETGVWMGKIPGLHPDQITYPDIIELLTIPDIKTGTLIIDDKYYSTVLKAKNRSIQNERWKLIYIPTHLGSVYQLYDLKADPYRNVIGSYPDIFGELRPILDEWISESI